MFKTIFALAIVLKTIFLGATAIALLCPLVTAQTYEILDGTALLQRRGQTYNTVRGGQLIEGDALVVPKGRSLQFLGDYGAFVATAKVGFYRLTLLRRYDGCIRDVISYRGTLNITPRPLLCPYSLLQVISLNSGGSYSFRGTNAWIEDRANTTKLTVEHGLVEASAQGITVEIPTGYGNITTEGQPPGEPIALDNDLQLRDLKIVRSALGVEISASLNPLNSMRIQGVEAVKIQGAEAETLRGFQSSPDLPIRCHLNFPIAGNSLNIEVRNSQGKRRIYGYPLPTRK
jgi:hypothetical protein